MALGLDDIEPLLAAKGGRINCASGAARRGKEM